MQVIINRGSNTNGFKPVEKFIISEYDNKVEYNNTIVVLGYNAGKSFESFKQLHPSENIVVFQLEQLSSKDNLWYNDASDLKMVQNRTIHIKEWLNGCDEIWEYDLENIEFLKSQGYTNVKHVPLYPIEVANYNIKEQEPEYDIAFYGALNDRRVEYLKELDKKYKLLVIYNKKGVYAKKYNPEFKNSLDLCYGEDLFKVLSKVKIVINIHYYTSQIQEQVRLFELLSNNKFVISEKSKIDYFGGAIPEFSDKFELFKLIDNYLSDIKIGVAYNTFYGLELLEEEIKKYRNKVHYIVLVHQKVGFSGNLEPDKNIELLNNLLKNKLVDDIVYYNLKTGTCNEMIDKRNIGLDYCKKNGCDYLVPLDADESYNFTKLRQSIIDNPTIDTFYSPIKTYYFNKNYYFDDFFHVASAYKIDSRKFKNISTSVIVDPRRKMRENNYKIIDIPLLHYNYLLDNYKYKLHEKISVVNNNSMSSLVEEVYDYLQTWKPGDKAKIIQYLNGTKKISLVNVLYDGVTLKKGYTADIRIEDDLVYKTVKDKVTKFKVSAEELIQREIYWLKKLEKYNISPRFIERKDNTIVMSYCGESPENINSYNDQLLNIIRILLENHCYYNDFKLDNFTVKNDRLYIIDFGWCPKIIEDYTCGEIESKLKEKPYKNIFNLFDSINDLVEPPVESKEVENKIESKGEFLTESSYFDKVNVLKEGNPEHWVTNKNKDDFNKRFEYHKKATDLLQKLNSKSVLEAGTMGVSLWSGSDTIDYDLPKSGWKLSYTPTYNHNLKELPWPIKDKQYDVFVALRVFHHFGENVSKYFKEMQRISKHIILALPKKTADKYKEILAPKFEYICENSDTVILYYDLVSEIIPSTLTVGLAYSGRVPGLFKEWMDKLADDTKNFTNPELIIVNNSKQELPECIKDYKEYFTIKEIKDDYNINPTSVQEKKARTSQFLAKSYSRIIKEAKGKIIHFREDDVIPIGDSFLKMIKLLFEKEKSIISGVYQTRHNKKGMSSDKDDIMIKNFQTMNGFKNGTIVDVEACGTGMVVCWKDNVPQQVPSRYDTLNSHDWCWCRKHKDNKGSVLVLTDAVCKHYIDKTEYVLPLGKLRPAGQFIKLKNVDKQFNKKRSIIKTN